MFSSKKVFPFTQRISKFSFRISKRDQEHFSDQLLGQFPPNLSFFSCMDSRHFVFRHLGFFFSDQYNRGALLSAKCKNVSVVSVAKKCKTFVGTRPREMITNMLNVILDTKGKKMDKD